MTPLSQEEIDRIKALNPDVDEASIMKDVAEYEALVSESFMAPPPEIDFETAEDEAGLPMPFSQPDDRMDRLMKLHSKLFKEDR